MRHRTDADRQRAQAARAICSREVAYAGNPCGTCRQPHGLPAIAMNKEKPMFQFYDGYHFFDMHMVWWFFWILLVGIVFGAYEPVRRNRRKTDELR